MNHVPHTLYHLQQPWFRLHNKLLSRKNFQQMISFFFDPFRQVFLAALRHLTGPLRQGVWLLDLVRTFLKPIGSVAVAIILSLCHSRQYPSQVILLSQTVIGVAPSQLWGTVRHGAIHGTFFLGRDDVGPARPKSG